MRQSPPQILLTNSMMLELLLTRVQERSIRDAIYENLRYLVFDELHTYRGRQGADVAMLIRRIRARCRHDVVCIGTSASPPTKQQLAAAIAAGITPTADLAALRVHPVALWLEARAALDEGQPWKQAQQILAVGHNERVRHERRRC